MVTFLYKYSWIILATCCYGLSNAAVSDRKNILFIVADDLGWNDVGWNNPGMPTPNLNKLASHGIILNQSYTLPVCTPSRAALLTGVYPFRMGLQQNAIEALQPNAVGLDYTLLPERLKRLGYSTYAIGKWHLGYCNKAFVPNSRGFDHFFGYYTGNQNYYYHNTSGCYKDGSTFQGYDFHDDYSNSPQSSGTYSAELFTNRAIDILHSERTKEEPFFMYLAYQNVHSPLQVPPIVNPKICKKYNQKDRRIYCRMVASLDDSVGKLVAELKATGLYQNTLIVFTSDNGGQVLSGGNNYPLRGNKGTLWEGGIRVPGFIHHKQLRSYDHTSDKMFHITDWYPTLIKYAGAKISQNVRILDGINQWPDIVLENRKAKRDYFIVNAKLENPICAGIRYQNRKILIGKPGDMDGWYKPDTKISSFDMGSKWSDMLDRLKLPKKSSDGEALTFWYFNIKKDPEERNNLKSWDPMFLDMMQKFSSEILKGYQPVKNVDMDPRGDPKYHGGNFTFGWCRKF